MLLPRCGMCSHIAVAGVTALSAEAGDLPMMWRVLDALLYCDVAIMPQCTRECRTRPDGRVPLWCNAREGTCETPTGSNLARSPGLECRCMAARLCYTRYAVPLCARRQTNPCRTLRLDLENLQEIYDVAACASHYATQQGIPSQRPSGAPGCLHKPCQAKGRGHLRPCCSTLYISSASIGSSRVRKRVRCDRAICQILPHPWQLASVHAVSLEVHLRRRGF